MQLRNERDYYMKVGIIGFNETRVMPYLKMYENLFQNNNIEYEVIEWDRKKNDLTKKDRNIYTIYVRTFKNKFIKIYSFFLWKKKIMKILKQKNYDFIIVLTTLPAILLKKYLLNNFYNKYIIDIRDYTYENFYLYRKIEKVLLRNSSMNIISSLGFKKFLDSKQNYYIVHNMPTHFQTAVAKELLNKDCITIGYVGIVNYFDQNIYLCKNLKNERKYNLYYRGIYLNDDLQKYCKDNKIFNVEFHGKFNNDEKSIIYNNIDFINAIYGNSSLLTITAIPNKFYDALIYRLPLLVSDNTYLGELVKKYNIGIALDTNEDIKTRISDFIYLYNKEEFERQCDVILKKCVNENITTCKKILQSLNNL